MLSVARAARLARSTKVAPIIAQRRPASTNSDHHDEHHEPADSTVYPKEGFSGSFWRYAFIGSLLIVGAHFVPSAESEEQPWLTRVLQSFAPSKEEFAKINDKHLLMSDEAAEERLTIQNASRPVMRTYRYPLSFGQVSPHRVPVGGLGSLDGLQVPVRTG